MTIDVEATFIGEIFTASLVKLFENAFRYRLSGIDVVHNIVIWTNHLADRFVIDPTFSGGTDPKT